MIMIFIVNASTDFTNKNDFAGEKSETEENDEKKLDYIIFLFFHRHIDKLFWSDSTRSTNRRKKNIKILKTVIIVSEKLGNFFSK